MRMIHRYRQSLKSGYTEAVRFLPGLVIRREWEAKRYQGLTISIDIKVYREYWEGVQKRIPEMKKVLPVTIDEEMSKTIQGLSKEECPGALYSDPVGNGCQPFG